MTIYLLKRSPHNEDFVLAGYATTVDELELLALLHAEEFYIGTLCAEVNMCEERVYVAEDGELCMTFEIIALEKIQKGDHNG